MFYSKSDTASRNKNSARPLLLLTNLGQRLDVLLVRAKIVKNITHAKKLIESQSVYVNNKIVSFSHHVVPLNAIVYVKYPFLLQNYYNITKRPKSRGNYIFRPHRLGLSTYFERNYAIAV